MELTPSHPESDVDNKVKVEVYKRQNMAKIEFEDSNVESDGSDDNNELVDDDAELIDTWEDGGNSKKTITMENDIRQIRDFCDGLEYQIQFQDPRFLTTFEKESAKFLKFAQACLSRERRFNLSQATSPATWEKSTANALFYRSRPRRDHDT